MLIIEDYGTELRAIEDWIKRAAEQGRPLKILEAGCGREWFFPLEGIAFELTGVDLDADALKAQVEQRGDLTHALVGDLRTVELAPAQFDVIYNAFVLEHVQGAEVVLQNFARWLRPGGLLVVRFPDRDSAHGLLARLTPHWAHVLYYKLAWRMKDAGKPGFPPYPTIYDRVLSRAALHTFCAQHSLAIQEEFGVGSYRRGHGLIRWITPIVARLVRVLSFGRIHDRYVDLTIIAQKAA